MDSRGESPKYALRLKPILEAAILGVLETLSEQPIAKGAGKFLVELSNRIKEEPDENQALMRDASDQEVNDTLTEILEGLDGTYREIAFAAQGVERLEDCAKSLQESLRDSLGKFKKKIDEIHAGVGELVGEKKLRSEQTQTQSTGSQDNSPYPYGSSGVFVMEGDLANRMVKHLIEENERLAAENRQKESRLQETEKERETLRQENKRLMQRLNTNRPNQETQSEQGND